jgi:hypothetical protein
VLVPEVGGLALAIAGTPHATAIKVQPMIKTPRRRVVLFRLIEAGFGVAGYASICSSRPALLDQTGVNWLYGSCKGSMKPESGIEP